MQLQNIVKGIFQIFSHEKFAIYFYLRQLMRMSVRLRVCKTSVARTAVEIIARALWSAPENRSSGETDGILEKINSGD